MSKIPSTLEQELHAMKPAGLDEAFLDRLVACADESFTDLSNSEKIFEDELRGIVPRNVQSSLQDKLMDVIGDAPFTVDEKIVMFNRSSKATVKKKAHGWFRFRYGAAAAVALLGGLTALMIPHQNSETNSVVAVEEKAMPSALPPFLPSNLAPTSFDRNFTGTSDEGLYWQDGKRPYRVYRQSYIDRFIGQDENGEAIELEQPHIEHVLIPEQVD